MSSLCRRTTNWQVSHTVPFGSNLVNQFRFGYVEATAVQHGATAPQSDIDPLQLTGVFTGLADDQRSYPAVGFAGVGSGLSGGGSAVNDYQSSNQPMWDISNTTTWIRGRHTLNFGANFRKWSLQRDLANDFLGQFTFSGFFTDPRIPNPANPATFCREPAIMRSPTSCWDTSPARAFSNRRLQRCGPSGNPRQFNFLYSRLTCRMIGK